VDARRKWRKSIDRDLPLAPGSTAQMTTPILIRKLDGYFRAKVAQEKLIETSGIPYTIIRSTQFLEFLPFAGNFKAMVARHPRVLISVVQFD
jgi:hypothetical protein